MEKEEKKEYEAPKAEVISFENEIVTWIHIGG